MKRSFTLLIIALFAIQFAKAETIKTSVETADFQAIVDYSNAQGLNAAEFPDNTDSYYGASAYYNNFDFRADNWNVGGSFTSWEEAAQEAIASIVLPAKFAEATTDDIYHVSFKYYDGISTKNDYFLFSCISSAPSPVFAALETPNGSYKAEIISFELTDQVTDAVIDVDLNTIEIMVAPGTNPAALAPTIVISEGATIDPASGATIDFSAPATFTVTAEDVTISKAWVVTVNVMEEAITPIYDIQFVADPATSDVSPFFEQTVITTGVVTAFGTFGSYNKYYIQDGAGAWNGIYVYDNTTGVVLEAGDEVKLTGKVAEYYLVSELEASKVEIISSRNTLPEPLALTTAITEEAEGVLVSVEGVTLSMDVDADDSKAFMLATKGDVVYKIFGELFDAVTYEEGKSYNLKGVVAYTYDNYRICPRSASDIETVTAVNALNENTFELYPNPTNSTLTIKGIDAENVNIINIAGQTVAVKQIVNSQIDVSELNNGVYFIKSSKGLARFVKK